MPTPLEYRFHHIHIVSSDAQVTERWLVTGVGAELVKRYDSRGVLISMLRLGGSEILLREARKGEDLTRADAPHFGINHFGLEVGDVDATVVELRRRDVTIEVEPWDFRPGVRIAFIKGPDDIRVELLQTH